MNNLLKLSVLVLFGGVVYYHLSEFFKHIVTSMLYTILIYFYVYDGFGKSYRSGQIEAYKTIQSFIRYEYRTYSVKPWIHNEIITLQNKDD